MAIKVDVVYYIALNPESLPALALLLSTCFCNDESRTGGTSSRTSNTMLNKNGPNAEPSWRPTCTLKLSV